jgi:D-alanyl-D-alanine carboxypeptidase-like protein
MSNLTDPVPISSIPNLNKGLTSAAESTMIAMMGAPREPFTTSCQNERISPQIKPLLETRRMTPQFRLTGIKPALDSVEALLAKVKVTNPELFDQLDTKGMICVRHKKPTDGSVSHQASNHSWGTAVDFKLIGGQAPGNTGPNVPRWVAILVPFFNAAGWVSGVGFHARDAMHFEVADETIRKWKADGLLGTTPPAGPAVVAMADTGGNAPRTMADNGSGGIGGFFSRLFGRG